MPVLHAIVAMSENRAIGFEGKIPWHLPLDFRWFKHKTMGGILIVGRKTLESLPQSLPGRECWVLSRHTLNRPEVKVYHETNSLLRDLPDDKIAWLSGGAQIYAELLPACLFLYLTRVKRTVPGDTFFPPFEDRFTLDQCIYENNEFRVERWRINNAPPAAPEMWPFP